MSLFLHNQQNFPKNPSLMAPETLPDAKLFSNKRPKSTSSTISKIMSINPLIITHTEYKYETPLNLNELLAIISKWQSMQNQIAQLQKINYKLETSLKFWKLMYFDLKNQNSKIIKTKEKDSTTHERNGNCVIDSTEHFNIEKHKKISKSIERIKTQNLNSEDFSNKPWDERMLQQVSAQETSNITSSNLLHTHHNQHSFSTFDKISNRFKKFISSKVDHDDMAHLKHKPNKKHKPLQKNDCDKNSVTSGNASVNSEDNLKIITKPRTKSEGSTGYLCQSYDQTSLMTSSLNTDTVQSFDYSLSNTPNKRETRKNNQLPPPTSLKNKSLSYQHLVCSNGATATHPSTPRNSTCTSPNKSTLILPQSTVTNDCYFINDMTTKANVTTIPKIITTNLTSVNPSIVHQPTLHPPTIHPTSTHPNQLNLPFSNDHPSRRHSTNLATLHEEGNNKNNEINCDADRLVNNNVVLTYSLSDDFFRKPLSSPPSLKTSLSLSSSSSSSSSLKQHIAPLSSDENQAKATKKDANYLELEMVEKFNNALMEKYIAKKPKKTFTFFKQDKKEKQRDKQLASKRHSLKVMRSFEGSKGNGTLQTNINHTVGTKNAFSPQLFKQLFDNSKTEAHNSHDSNKDFVSKLSEWEDLKKKKSTCEINRTRSACDSKKPTNLSIILPSNQNHFFQSKNPFSPKPNKNSGFTSDLSSLKALYEAKSIENKLALQTHQEQGVRQRKISMQTLPSQQPFRLTFEYAADDNNIPNPNKSSYENPFSKNYLDQNSVGNKENSCSSKTNHDGFNLLTLPFMMNNKPTGVKQKIRKISLESNKRIKSPRSSMEHDRVVSVMEGGGPSFNGVLGGDGECDRCKKLVVKHHNFISQNNKLVQELLEDNQTMDKDLMMKEMTIDKLEEEVKQLKTKMKIYNLRLELIYKHLNKPALGRCCGCQSFNSLETLSLHFMSDKILKFMHNKLYNIPLLVPHTPMCIFNALHHVRTYPSSSFCPSFYHSCEQLHNLTDSFNEFCNLLLKQLVFTQNQLLEKMKTMEKNLNEDLKNDLEDLKNWIDDRQKNDFDHNKDNTTETEKDNEQKKSGTCGGNDKQNYDIHKEVEKMKPEENRSKEMVQKNTKEEKNIHRGMNDKERFLKCLRILKTNYDQEVASLKVRSRVKDMVLADYERCLFVEKINNKLLIVKFIKEIKRLQRSPLRSKLEWQKEKFVDFKKITKTERSLYETKLTCEETRADLDKRIFINDFIHRVEKEIAGENSKLTQNNYENEIVTIFKENQKEASESKDESKKFLKLKNHEKRRTKSNKDPPTTSGNTTKKHKRSGAYENSDWSMFRCTKGTQKWKLRQAKLPYFEIEALEFDDKNYETPNERKMKEAIEAEKRLNVSEKENIKNAPDILISNCEDKSSKNKSNLKKINNKNEKSKKKIKSTKSEKEATKEKNMLKHLSIDSKLRRLREEKDFAEEFESRDLEKVISECLQYIDDSIGDSENKKINNKFEQKNYNTGNKSAFITKSLNLDNKMDLLKNASAFSPKKDLIEGEKITDKRKEELRKNTKRLKEKVPESIKNNGSTKKAQQLSPMRKTENECNLDEQSIIELNQSEIKPFTDNGNSKNKNQCEQDNKNSLVKKAKNKINKKSRLSICKRLCLLHHHSNEDDRLDFIQ